MNSQFFRILKEGIQSVRRHAAMSFSSASAVMMTLFIVGIFIICHTNVQHIVNTVENSVQIHAKVELTVEDENIPQLEQKIRAIDGVKTVTFSNKDSELDAFIEAYGEQGELFKMYVGENNPLRHAFLVEVKDGNDIEMIANSVKAIQGIENVNYGGSGTLTLVSSMESIKTGSFVAVAVLGLLAVLLITNTIDTTINARKEEIFIMRTVGAANNFIRGPFIVEGIIIGILGSLIPIIVLSVGYILLYNLLDGHLFTELLSMAQPNTFILNQSLILLGAGILVGATGSFIAVTRRLRWKR